MKTTIVKLDPKAPDAGLIRQAALALTEGKIVAFPTETVYGIGACESKKNAVDRLYDLKGRPSNKPFSYHIGELGDLEKLGVSSSSAFRFLKKLFWPGPVTFLVWNDREEKIGIRFPKNEIAKRLICQCGELFIATSANISGKPSAKSAQAVETMFGNQVDMILDGGACVFSEDSTVVDMTVSPPKIVRQGAEIQAVKEALEKVARGRFPRKKILLVCTGNTCRSPMAEGWLHHELQRNHLEGQIELSSCGTIARDGAYASQEALLVLKNDEIDFEHFRTSACRREEVIESDLIIVMTEEHRKYISSFCPNVRAKMINLEVDDPIGLSYQAYERSYLTIKERIKQHWKEVTE